MKQMKQQQCEEHIIFIQDKKNVYIIHKTMYE